MHPIVRMILAVLASLMAASCGLPTSDDLGPSPRRAEAQRSSDELEISYGADARASKMQHFTVEGPQDRAVKMLYFTARSAGRFFMTDFGYGMGQGCAPGSSTKLTWQIQFMLWDPWTQAFTRPPNYTPRLGDQPIPWFEFELNAGERVQLKFDIENSARCQKVEIYFLPTFEPKDSTNRN